jgi:hypothetical protein
MPRLVSCTSPELRRRANKEHRVFATASLTPEGSCLPEHRPFGPVHPRQHDYSRHQREPLIRRGGATYSRPDGSRTESALFSRDCV